MKCGSALGVPRVSARHSAALEHGENPRLESFPLDSIRGLTEKAESSGAMMKMMNTTDHVMNFAPPPDNWDCLPRCWGADTAADIPGEQGSH